MSFVFKSSATVLYKKNKKESQNYYCGELNYKLTYYFHLSPRKIFCYSRHTKFYTVLWNLSDTIKAWHGFMEQIWHNNFCFQWQTKFATILWNELGTIFFATILFYNTFISHDNQSLPRSGTKCFATILFYNTFISHHKQSFTQYYGTNWIQKLFIPTRNKVWHRITEQIR